MRSTLNFTVNKISIRLKWWWEPYVFDYISVFEDSERENLPKSKVFQAIWIQWKRINFIDSLDFSFKAQDNATHTLKLISNKHTTDNSTPQLWLANYHGANDRVRQTNCRRQTFYYTENWINAMLCKSQAFVPNFIISSFTANWIFSLFFFFREKKIHKIHKITCCNWINL